MALSNDESLEILEAKFVHNIGVLLLFAMKPAAFEGKNFENLANLGEKFLIDTLDGVKNRLPIDFYIVLRNTLFSNLKYRVSFNDLYNYQIFKKNESKQKKLYFFKRMALTIC